jgi:hypothetical protein
MTARELDDASRDLRQMRGRTREGAALAVLSALAAVAVAPLSVIVAIACGAGAAAGGLTAIISALTRRDRIARLALEPAAYELEEVARYARRLTAYPERERLASWLGEILTEARIPGSWYLQGRVARHAEELATLAGELADPRARVRPSSAATCRLLLTQGVDSPLYNPAVPADELPALIRRVRLGISVTGAS